MLKRLTYLQFPASRDLQSQLSDISQLAGSITFQSENNYLIQIEGSAENTAAFILWYLTDVATENINNQVAISSGPVHHCKEFVINNYSDDF